MTLFQNKNMLLVGIFILIALLVFVYATLNQLKTSYTDYIHVVSPFFYQKGSLKKLKIFSRLYSILRNYRFLEPPYIVKAGKENMTSSPVILGHCQDFLILLIWCRYRYTLLFLLINHWYKLHTNSILGGAVVIITVKLHSRKHELRFYAGSNSARSVWEIRNGEDLWGNGLGWK